MEKHPSLKGRQSFSMKKRAASFSHAFNGLHILWNDEHNTRIHVIIGLIVIVAGFYFDLTRYEWLAICGIIALVLSAECFNSAIENLSDFVRPEYHETIKKVKDLSAAAVLICAIASVIVGLIVFIPYLRRL